MNSQEALERIRRGIDKFQTAVYPSQREVFETLARSQEPIALFITCVDSRIVPNLITQTGPGELFVERNPGNLVPHHEEFAGGVWASVEYAVLALRVPLVIICGHTDSGVMKGLLHPEKVEQLPAMRQWMRHAERVHEQMLCEAAVASEDEKLNLVTQHNVRLQMENLKTHPGVRSRFDAGELEIAGWIYNIAAGSAWTVNSMTGNFEPVTRASQT